ncbi:MAG: sigma 54-interacting transcriptional regulator [Pseudomonadota bacterium]
MPMQERKKDAITLLAQEEGPQCTALVQALRRLDYAVDVVSPDQAPMDGRGRLAYLGPLAWPEGKLERAASAHLLALDQRAFDWIGSAAERLGAFLTWPCSLGELRLRLRQHGFRARSERDLSQRAALQAAASASGFLGQASAFVDALVSLHKFAQSDAAVLIEGETGTGKEAAARLLHQQSARARYPFEVVRCGTVEAQMLAEMAPASAPGGVLFLDEVDDLAGEGQVALLRLLDRLGEGRGPPRIISASTSDLEQRVRQGSFRRDLFYRLNVLGLRLPALRDRPGDAVLLAEHFLGRFAGQYRTRRAELSPACRRWLATQSWPGNVRELENHIHRSVVTAEAGRITLADDEGAAETNGPRAFNDAKREAIDRFERAYLTELLERTGGNVSRAARLAGKERRALGKLLCKHAISSDTFRAGPIRR